MIVQARILVAGSASGPVAAAEPLSFWGGYDPATGTVIDRSHPQVGRTLKGHVLVMSCGRGSSSSSSVLAEAIRLGTAPAAIVLAEPDPILAVGAMVAETLYGRTCPVLILPPPHHAALACAAKAEIAIDGSISVLLPASSSDAAKRGSDDPGDSAPAQARRHIQTKPPGAGPAVRIQEMSEAISVCP